MEIEHMIKFLIELVNKYMQTENQFDPRWDALKHKIK